MPGSRVAPTGSDQRSRRFPNSCSPAAPGSRTGSSATSGAVGRSGRSCPMPRGRSGSGPAPIPERSAGTGAARRRRCRPPRGRRSVEARRARTSRAKGLPRPGADRRRAGARDRRGWEGRAPGEPGGGFVGREEGREPLAEPVGLSARAKPIAAPVQPGSARRIVSGRARSARSRAPSRRRRASRSAAIGRRANGPLLPSAFGSRATRGIGRPNRPPSTRPPGWCRARAALTGGRGPDAGPASHAPRRPHRCPVSSPIPSWVGPTIPSPSPVAIDAGAAPAIPRLDRSSGTAGRSRPARMPGTDRCARAARRIASTRRRAASGGPHASRGASGRAPAGPRSPALAARAGLDAERRARAGATPATDRRRRPRRSRRFRRLPSRPAHVPAVQGVDLESRSPPTVPVRGPAGP